MKMTAKTLIWMLIFVITAYDCYFTARHAKLFLASEINPLARFIFAHWGLIATLGFRLCVSAFALWAASRPVRPARLVTPIWAVAHLYLATVYCIIWELPPY
jgi:hypothetical protein